MRKILLLLSLVTSMAYGQVTENRTATNFVNSLEASRIFNLPVLVATPPVGTKVGSIAYNTSTFKLANWSGTEWVYYLTELNAQNIYTPLTRSITINGVTQDLSQNRNWTIIGNPGTVTSFGKTDGIGIISTVTNPTSTPNHTISVDTAVIRTTANSVSLSQLQSKFSTDAILNNPSNIPENKTISTSDSIKTTGVIKGNDISIMTPFVGPVNTSNDSYSFRNSLTRTGRLGLFYNTHTMTIPFLSTERWFFGSGGSMVFLPGKQTGDSHSGGILLGDRDISSKKTFGFYTQGGLGRIAFNSDTLFYNFTNTFKKDLMTYDENGIFKLPLSNSKFIIGTDIDNGIDKLQVAGTATANEFKLYGTTDQVTNYERLHTYFSANANPALSYFTIDTENGGTGLKRRISFGKGDVPTTSIGTTPVNYTLINTDTSIQGNAVNYGLSTTKTSLDASIVGGVQAFVKTGFTSTPAFPQSLVGVRAVAFVSAANTINWPAFSNAHPVISGTTSLVGQETGATGSISKVSSYYGTITGGGATIDQANLMDLTFGHIGTINYATGVRITDVNAGTNNTFLLMNQGDSTMPPIGNYGIYNATNYNNVLGSGNTLIGSTTDNGAQLQIFHTAADALPGMIMDGNQVAGGRHITFRQFGVDWGYIDNNAALFGAGIRNKDGGINAAVNTTLVGTTITRNVADASAALIVRQSNAGSTGDLLNLQFGGLVSKFKIDYRGIVGINGTLLTAGQSFRTNAAGTASEAFTPATTTDLLSKQNLTGGNSGITGDQYSTGNYQIQNSASRFTAVNTAGDALTGINFSGIQLQNNGFVTNITPTSGNTANVSVQVRNLPGIVALTSELTGKANLAGGNIFTGADQNIVGGMHLTGDATRSVNTIDLLSSTSGSGYRGALQLKSYNVDGTASTWTNTIIANPSAAANGSSNQVPASSGTLINSNDAQNYVKYGNNGGGFGGNAFVSFGNDNSQFTAGNTAGTAYTRMDPLGFSISNNSGLSTKFVASGTNTTGATVSVRNLTGVMALVSDIAAYAATLTVTDAASVVYTKATLNSTYPTAPVRFKVVCNNMGITYEKYDSTNWFATNITILP